MCRGRDAQARRSKVAEVVASDARDVLETEAVVVTKSEAVDEAAADAEVDVDVDVDAEVVVE